ncbi:MAG: BMP family ABC transporter substrate-binding protein [Caldilineaceae bacterium]
MNAFRNNLALILVSIIAVLLIFLALRLQVLIMNNQETPPASQNEAEVLQPQQQLTVVVQPTAVLPTNTPELPTPTAEPPTPTAVALAPTATTGGYTVYGSEVIGAIHVGSISDHGYNQAHHDGLQQMIEQVPGVRLIEVDNVPETEAVLPIIDDMVQQGAKIIFVQSFGYLPFAIQAAERYPDVIFLHPGGFELRDNLGTYWANNFEAMYLAGIAAGATTQSNQLGFITAFPIPNILASVNAFHLGARSVNPDVTTKLVIDESWVDPDKEQRATQALAAVGVDVVTMIVDSPTTVVQTAEALGIYVIGFHSDSLAELAPNSWLTGIAYTWGNYYTSVVQQIRAGQWHSSHVRGGIESDMLRLAAFGPAVSEETKTRILTARTDIIRSQLQIFKGPLVDNQGIERIAAGQIGGLELLDTTDWLVAGVSNFDATSVAVENLPAVTIVQPVAQAATEPEAAAQPTEAPTPTAPPPPTATDLPVVTADLVFGVTDDHAQCSFFTQLLSQIIQEHFGLSVEIADYNSDDTMYAEIANRQNRRTVDLTVCFGDPKDRPYLREYFGFLKPIGGIYWETSGLRLQVMSNSGVVVQLQREQRCVYDFLKNLHFEGDELPNQDPTQWIADNAQTINTWVNCQP